jgi:diaminohydroxyphosphoribosylaminopyrimidine deaminase/5-amino-6-(5-phosphoribosylamino)uracil reductase
MPENANDNNNLWKLILAIKVKLPIERSAFYLSFSINYNSDDFVISEKSQIPDPDRILISYNVESNDGWALNVSFSESLNWPVFENNSLPEDQLIFIKRYLPFVLIKLKSYRRKSAYAIGHLAMSLDGKIATKNGQSQWIGNKRNQIHSHRMRALADAILVGGNTYIKDKPQLNVRHVTGADPIKIVMGDRDYESVNEVISADVIWVKSKSIKNSNTKVIIIDRNDDGFRCDTLLDELYKKNIHSVYIEGGGITISGFITSKSLDILQLHYAPILMGSGIPCITLPEISEVGQAINFMDHQMEKMEDEWMFTGTINYNN